MGLTQSSLVTPCFSFFLSYFLFQADPLKHRGSLRSLFCQGFKDFISFLCKPRNISLFLSSIFLSSTFFPYLSLNQLPTQFLLWVSLYPAGAGPRHRTTGEMTDNSTGARNTLNEPGTSYSSRRLF